MLVKHPEYPEKNIPGSAIDKFLDFGWSAVPLATDTDVKASHKAKEDAKAVEYAKVNDMPLEDAKKIVKGTIR